MSENPGTVENPMAMSWTIVRQNAIYRLAHLLIHRHHFTVFGSVVLSGLLNNLTFNGVPFRHELEIAPIDLDVHAPTDIDEIGNVCSAELSFKTLKNICRNFGFLLEKSKDDRPKDSDYPGLKREKFTVTLMNSHLIFDKSVEFNMDVVFCTSRPPFQNLDFSCKGWIWDEHSVRFSKNCGIYQDSMTPADRIIFSASVLSDAKKMRTEVIFPRLIEGAENSANRARIFALRILGMLKKGWVITNYNNIAVQNVPANSKSCRVCCAEIESGTRYIQASCCQTVAFHLSCFGEWMSTMLEQTKFLVSCPMALKNEHHYLMSFPLTIDPKST